MFTPEFTKGDGQEYVLVANHYVETPDALALSIAFTRARIAFGRSQVPVPDAVFAVHYDVRGQKVASNIEEQLKLALSDVAKTFVKTV
ncbi:hypothetical protein [Ralstonia wenshanensis]|uniref:Uncharacterized protein n=1 Tax=Ralstonia wenshanensis TaxID=2842456 RepID=A0AAD2ET02_9RALS|nr:hypothetical protein [Ralstonia wenshanensis]CAJ0705439.1 hypothetical protein LMG18091_04439 [Ralstonia wenshanensis]